MRLRTHLIVILAAVVACVAGPALADGDVTMTVIPSGGDVVKTVVQNITVPTNADKVAKNAEPRKAPAAGHDNEAGQQTAQQLAEASAEHQAGQTQQLVQQQALQAAQIAASKAKSATPPPAPPPAPKPPRL